MALHIRAAKLPEPVREHRFHPQRRWRLDFAWPDRKVALEVEGGIFVNGRHSRGAGMEADMEKYNSAVEMGWRVFRVSKNHIKSGEALQWIEAALKLPPKGGFELIAGQEALLDAF